MMDEAYGMHEKKDECMQCIGVKTLRGITRKMEV